MTDRPGIWVYAVTDAGDDLVLPAMAGVAGAEVRAAPLGGAGGPSSPATAAGLTVVVSDADLAEFGQDALRSNLEDLDWLTVVAHAHHGVIEAVARLCTVLPMRLATVYANEASMHAALAARTAQLRAALDRLRSRTEWGVKGYAAPPADAARPATPQVSARHDGQADDAGGGTGLAYLRRRRDALSAQRQSWRGAAEGAQAAHAELARHCAASRLHPAQSPQLSGRKDAMVLNGAYLIDNDRAAEFSAAVAALNDADPRLRLELTGPWPPYSFTAEGAG